jgi:hypothetical protein
LRLTLDRRRRQLAAVVVVVLVVGLRTRRLS